MIFYSYARFPHDKFFFDFAFKRLCLTNLFCQAKGMPFANFIQLYFAFRGFILSEVSADFKTVLQNRNNIFYVIFKKLRLFAF